MKRLLCAARLLSMPFAACLRVEVLTTMPATPSTTSCAAATDAGESCAFAGTCERATSLCCSTTLSCVDGGVVFAPDQCRAGCRTCTGDTDCGTQALCVGGLCTRCPDPAGCTPPASGTWFALTRNGCSMCEFTPTAPCLEVNACIDPQEVCYQGARCVPGCTTRECCGNQCALAGCSGPAPVGCESSCDGVDLDGGTDGGCSRCVTNFCFCDPDLDRWSCASTCAEDVSIACTFTP